MKPSIQDVVPSLLEYYRRDGNDSGGIFHVIVADKNYEQCHAVSALENAQASGDALEIKIAELLIAMSTTQRRKLSASWGRIQYAAGQGIHQLIAESDAKRHREDDSSFGM
jgi:hypothetical protein